MVSTKEAATMDYLTYKRTVWARLVTFWLGWIERHPEDVAAQRRLHACRQHYDRWHPVPATPTPAQVQP